MPVDKKKMAAMKETYGAEKGEKVYYAAEQKAKSKKKGKKKGKKPAGKPFGVKQGY